MKLYFTHSISEGRDFGTKTVHQDMVISVDYDPVENSYQYPEVSILQDGKFLCEISKLLDKAEGGPLVEMLEAIDWRSLYYEQMEEKNSFTPFKLSQP